MLLLLGCGVVATAILKGSKGEGGGWLLINFGWGLAVFAGVYVAFRSGAHLNPAVTLGLAIVGPNNGGIQWSQVPIYWGSELLGAFIGAVLAGVQAAFRRRGGSGQEARRLLHRPGDPQLRLEHHHRDPGHLRPGVRDPYLRWHAVGPGAAVRRAAGRRHRRLAGWSDRVRDQPGPRPRSARRPRHPADPGQGFLRLGVLLGADRRPADRRCDRRAVVPGTRRQDRALPGRHLIPGDAPCLQW